MRSMIIREIRENELSELLELYTHLHERGVPENSGATKITTSSFVRLTENSFPPACA